MWPKINKDRIPIQYSAFMFFISLLVISGGIMLYNSQKNKILSEKLNELAAISLLKIEDITQWRLEHIRDGKIISNIVPRNKLIFSFLENNTQPELRQELLERMEAFIEGYDYHSILLADARGNVRLAYPPVNSDINNSLGIQDLQDSSASDVSFSDLHFSDDLPGLIHIDVHIPLITPDNSKIGTIIMRVDPQKILYPLVQSWPTPSRSSEILLIRIENDSLLYLNELRHRENTALKFKLPLGDKDLPASVAVSGYEGVFEGVDYRGVSVISYLSKVPGSQWFMVAKVDKKEIYAPVKEQIFLILFVTALIILSVITFTVYYWRHKHVDYLKELNATKDKFFSIVSHDLKSPFTSINGFAYFLVDEVQNNEFKNIEKYAGIILDSSQNALDLLKNLTEWSKLQTNRINFTPKEIDVASIINEVAELMDAPAKQKSITLIREVPPRFKIVADKQMISTVLRNLISNSIKFSYPGGRVYISVVHKMNRILFEVKDFGIGIRRDLIDKLFRIEESVSMPGTQRESGTGLGLILAKEFVMLHKGKIWVESEIGKGSTFYFTIPD